MTRTIFLATAAAAAIAATPAAAQDNDAFTGLRVEGLVGYDSSRAGSDVDNDSTEDIDDGIDGLAYGVGAGYDFAMGGVVLGIEGEFMGSNADTRTDFDNDVGLSYANLDTGRDIYTGARIGFLAGDRTLIYAKGGYTNARYNVLASDGVTDTETNVDLDGWRAGGGVEFALSDNIYIKGEYRYSNYGEGEVEAPSGMESDRFTVDVDRHQVVAGVGVRF